MSSINRWLIGICAVSTVWANPIQTRETDYVMPNSTGFRMQHGFETVLVQPFGYDGFRVRAWPYRPPTGNEISFIYDPPLEGFEDGKAHGLDFDTAFNGNRTVAIRNGKMVVRTSGWGGNPGALRGRDWADPTVAWSANIDTLEYRELYVRWFQWATFLPFMRTHGSRKCNVQNAYTCNNEPWSYGEENTSIIVSYIQLRYQLKAYIQAVFEQYHQTGRAIMRTLYMDFERRDPQIAKMTRENVNATTQQYMFGPRLLVTPVTLPNATEWEVYLPQTGQNETKTWTYWWTNRTYAGGQTVTVPAPIEHIPLFYLGKREDIMSGSVF
ncbi:hypothetical protein Aspvir_001669 [Aspergillus viridinutans]|uniref:Uncharacterized protein n=1 Tax=Aspergillus viridinutans TaxID=75553 RepID=A0A9P3BUD3_ASPVI|nr:uncharacterized protein Aspvir_001669 [Aspergillus viridinutans]GIJ99536.1 hypothetical protein Aspvir_001669 [Aspergillus viridinutans]